MLPAACCESLVKTNMQGYKILRLTGRESNPLAASLNNDFFMSACCTFHIRVHHMGSSLVTQYFLHSYGCVLSRQSLILAIA